MQHKTLMGMSVGVNEEPIPTQEFIRRAVEDAGLEDEDFSQNPWLFAVDFVRSQGLVGVDGVAIGTPLSQIKNGMINGDRVSQIVAIVKSTTPNGLGDMMATLKDPTGTIDASIHRRVLTEGELGKDLSVGAVLILHKVAVFSPSRSACCLNITVSNIVKRTRIDPDAEVVSLSPKTLLVSDGYVYEICNHGFQRDQNLQMHRRRHKVPWKLLKRETKEVKKRVFVCPEPSCLHHDSCHAVGDFVGIKKHSRRKHNNHKLWFVTRAIKDMQLSSVIVLCSEGHYCNRINRANGSLTLIHRQGCYMSIYAYILSKCSKGKSQGRYPKITRL